MPHREISSKRNSEQGQSIVLLALLLVVLVGLAALAIDGGNAFVRRRNAQNAADAAALGATQYVINFNNKTETGLRERVNAIVEAHGVPDTDGIAGNSVNDNVTIIYTDDRGVHLTGCHVVPCGSIPIPARGVEVEIAEAFDTFMASVIGRDQLGVAATAIAYARANNPGGLSDAGMVALGDCAASDRPFDGSGFFVNRGNYIHYHGAASYVDGLTDTSTGSLFDGSTYQTTSVADPFASLFTVSSFNASNIGTTVPGIPSGEYHDLSADIFGGEVNNNDLFRLGLYQRASGGNPPRFVSGVYYLGNNDIALGDNGMVGNITIVSSATIKVTGRNVNLNAYIPAPSVAEGLLFYTSKTPDGGRCDSQQPRSWVINMTGSESNTRPTVNHAIEV